MTDMRKRAKSMLDYLARVQVEMAERGHRSPADGTCASTPASPALNGVRSLSTTNGSAGVFGLMDDLSRDLIKFQDKFLGRSGLANSTLADD